MRSLVAVLAGILTAIVAYWCGAIVALLALHGIPLGSPGGPPTVADISVHVVLAAIASFGGCLVAIRISRASPRLNAWAVGLMLAIGAILSFSKASSNWPPWFGFAMAAACIGGALAAAQRRKPLQ